MRAEYIVIILLAALSSANGANDVSKGVATLVGSGVTRYRTAILWGAVSTLAGSLLSGILAARMLLLFTSGIVLARPTPPFTLFVICGAAGWVAVATLSRLPLSTTHAIIGSLIGAGIFYAPPSIAWAGLLANFALPLLFTIVFSYLLSATLIPVFLKARVAGANCVCVSAQALETGAMRVPQVNVLSGTTEECSRLQCYLKLNASTLHWVSSGAVGFARGLNDTPKLIAIGALVVGGHLDLRLLSLVVSGAMFAGGLYAGRGVTRLMAEKIIRMDHTEGLLANMVTATLVGIGSNLGLPMSTTQVSASAIAGIAGVDRERLNWRTVRHLILAWTVTPLVAGLIAATSYLIATMFV